MKRAGHPVVGEAGRWHCEQPSAAQQIQCTLWTRRLITVFTGPYLNHVNAVQILETHFFIIHFNIIPHKRNTGYSEAEKRRMKCEIV